MKFPVILTGLAFSSTLFAATIVTPNGSPNSGFSISLAQVMAVQFTLTTGYNNVVISASLFSIGSGDTGQAFLTNSIGPGTTFANQIASNPFSFVQVANLTTITNVSLFSGLTLGAGSYDIVFTTTNAAQTANISRLSGGSYLTAPGTNVTTFFANSPNASYAPASQFFNFSGQAELFFTVSGDSAVPEPSTVAMLATGAGALWLARRRLAK